MDIAGKVSRVPLLVYRESTPCQRGVLCGGEEINKERKKARKKARERCWS
jgi:hypothetical protein